MGSTKVQKFSNSGVERQPGEVARLRILKGPDEGKIFVIQASSIVLGRGEGADVRLADLKFSRNHARIDFTQEGWLVSDLGSANGILFQGEYIRKFILKSGEHFTIGDTILEFLAGAEATPMLTSPLKSGTEVEQLDRALSLQKARVQSYSKPLNSVSPSNKGQKKSNPRTLILVALLAAAYFFTVEDEAPRKTTKTEIKKGKTEEGDERNLASDSGVTNREVFKTAEQYYRQGFREYREKNYLRAKAQFELALQVNPEHAMARHYLMVAEEDIANEIKKMINTAQKSLSAGRLREAKGYYQAAMRLMYQDQTNPDYIESEDAVKKIDQELERTRQ